VPKVPAFSVHGLVLRFSSHDRLPPHFHAEKPGRWEVKVRFRLEPADMIEVVSKTKPRASELKELKMLAEEHRVALLIEWEAKVLVNDPGLDK
jgi:hypothetical protein